MNLRKAQPHPGHHMIYKEQKKGVGPVEVERYERNDWLVFLLLLY